MVEFGLLRSRVWLAFETTSTVTHPPLIPIPTNPSFRPDEDTHCKYFPWDSFRDLWPHTNVCLDYWPLVMNGQLVLDSDQSVGSDTPYRAVTLNGSLHLHGNYLMVFGHSPPLYIGLLFFLSFFFLSSFFFRSLLLVLICITFCFQVSLLLFSPFSSVL